jgi:CYTH domain-containing protein
MFEVDEFLGDNTGLVVAELELQSQRTNFRGRHGSASKSATGRATTM